MKISKLHIKLNNETIVDIKFHIASSLALVGQSGSGKSLSLKAILGMLPTKMECELQCDSEFDIYDKKNIAFVPQNPFTALSPLTKIKKQFFCDILKVQELFELVGLDIELAQRYAPELSGGQLQRVIIAMALQNHPKLMLLDEPTTALDQKTRDLILELLKRLQQEYGFKMLFVTHDIASAKMLCQDIVILKDGKVVEFGEMSKVLQEPKEAYTTRLIEANFANREWRI